MLDLAFGLTHTSRLGCQIRMSNELDGLVVKLPAATRKSMLLLFARAAASRLQALIDPAGPYTDLE